MSGHPAIDTSIISWSDLSSSLLFAKMGTVASKILVRITGGCADMDEEHQQGVLDLFGAAFEGFDGVMLIGGTRMIRGENPNDVVFGIAEVGPHIRRHNKDAYVVGVTPRVLCTIFKRKVPMIVVEHHQVPQGLTGITTIVHPGQDLAVHVNDKLTNRGIWYDEAQFCADIAHMLRRYAGWRHLVVVYNGGEVTEYEVLHTAAEGWPILLVEGSGRMADKLAEDKYFLRTHPNVGVCQNNPQSMRQALVDLGAIRPTADQCQE